MASIAMAPRHDSMDVVRGFAVMGILLLNIIAFAMPSAAYLNPLAWGGGDPADLSAWAIAQILFDGKFRGLFSLMFGASMLLVMERAAMAGEDPRAVHFNRIFWLLLFGLAHHLLLWWGDVLALYALCGSVAVFFARKSAGSLTKLAFLFFGLHILLCGLFAVSQLHMRSVATAPGASVEDVRRYADTVEGFAAPGSPKIAEELAIYGGDYAGMLAHRIHGFAGEMIGSTLFNLFDTIGMMLLGMAMLKSGFLTGSWPPDLYRRTMRHCFLIGFPPMILLTAWVWHGGFDTLDTFLLFILYAFPFRIPLVVGYAALFTWIATTHAGHPLILRVRAVGRAAFSNYLGTSLVMTTVFYGYGLGLFGKVDRAPVYLFVIAAWGLMLLWSKPWLDRFAYGPFEWLWRTLARRRLQPMRRTASQ
ncbi:DUF418 domain-containing protein [Sphingobium aquiterrae]|uniref:DUF418 domain-containing protein n=1 Tax=Sphingobium aquiterrae TaxID=2038656 RepID=UPI00301697BA